MIGIDHTRIVSVCLKEQGKRERSPKNEAMHGKTTRSAFRPWDGDRGCRILDTELHPRFGPHFPPVLFRTQDTFPRNRHFLCRNKGSFSSTTNPAATHHQLSVVKHARLPRRDSA